MGMQGGKERKRRGYQEVFLSHRKYVNISNRVINLDNFQKDVLHRTVFEYYDDGEFPAAIK
jgi:hypothetical protein